MKKTIAACAVAASCMLAVPAQADVLYKFGQINLSTQQWDHGPTPIKDGTDGAMRNQEVIGLEGGIGFDWGDFYGFYDLENISESADEQKTSWKITGHVYIPDTKFSVYGQVYSHRNPAQSEENRVLGFGYTGFGGDGWFFKPYIGVHQVLNWDSYSPNPNVNGNNGFMAGWVGVYNFEAIGRNWTLSNWNEIEFARDDAYAENQGGDTGVNGGLMISTDVAENISMGVTYRYFYNKLGVYGSTGGDQHYGDAIIYNISYKF